MTRLFDLDCRPPWLIAAFPLRQKMVSWSLNRPGFTEAQTVAWLQVSDKDLPPGLDPLALLEQRLAEERLSDAVGLMTAREVRHHHHAAVGTGDSEVETVITLGLSNGSVLDVGGRLKAPSRVSSFGTINMLLAVASPLSQGAMLEALSVATMARTAALLADGGQIIGTGTDCIVVACPDAMAGETFSGLHTAIGTNITEAVYAATLEGRRLWEMTYG